METPNTVCETEQESMGCCSSNAIRPLNIGPDGTSKEHAPTDPPINNKDAEIIQSNYPPINNKDAEIIQSNWQIVEQDLQGHGLSLFKRLFTQNPSIQTKFYFTMDNEGDLDAIMADERLAKHAKGVMDTISVAVIMLHDLSTLIPILKQLGASHAKFQLKETHFQAVGGALLWTLESALGDEFNEQARKAWVSLYTVVTAAMASGAEDAEKDSKAV